MKTSSKSPFSIWRDQIDRRDLQRLSQFEQRHHGRIAGAALQATDVLLAVPGFLGKPFLCQTAREPDLQHSPQGQLPHVHADWLDGYRRVNLSTYASLLDAVAAGVDWRLVTATLFGVDAAVDEQAAKQVFDANLARARWMTTVGYRLLAGLPR